MKNIALSLLFLSVFSLPLSATADDDTILNSVYLQLNTEKWVTTDTAKVTVRIDATMDQKELASAHQTILSKLQKIATQAPWHITTFQRSKDQSGLERIYAIAESRLPESALAALRDRAKAVTKAGETFTINNIDFTPSQMEYEKARAELRDDIYQLAKAELGRLNSVYPEQKYTLHSINFLSGPVVQAVRRDMAYKTSALAESIPSPAPMAVSGKLKQQAVVILAEKEKIS